MATQLQPWGPSGFLRTCSDCVGRGLPLLLLNSRTHDFDHVPSVEEALQHLDHLESALNDAGTCNFLYTSMWAFLHMVFDGSDRFVGRHPETQLSEQIWSLLEPLREQEPDQLKGMKSHRRATQLIEGAFKLQEKAMDFCRKLRLARWASYRHACNMCSTEGQLNNLLENMSHNPLFHSEGTPYTQIEVFDAVEEQPDFEKVQGMRGGKEWVDVVRLVDGADVVRARSVITGYIEDEVTRWVEQGQPVWYDQAFEGSDFRNALKVLTSPHTFSSNLRDIPRITRLLHRIHQLDAVPERNSTAALHLLRRAWDNVDIYSHVADRMKRFAKMSYYAMVGTGFIVVVLTIIQLNKPEATMTTQQLNVAILVVSSMASLLALIMTLLDPMTRWRQLRSTALTIEGEIWKFRTRTGHYSQSQGESSGIVEERLRDVLQEVEEHVVNSAGIMGTSFMARLEIFGRPKNHKIYKHGQYRDSTVLGANGILDDNHQSPLNPAEYLSFRVEKVTHFYQGRLPKYDRMNRVAEVLLASTTVSSPFLCFFGLAQWAGIGAAFSSCVVAVREFNNPKEKLERYSSSIHEINEVLLWWRALSTLEQSSPSCCTILVSRCEDAIQRERSSWMAASLPQRLFHGELDAAKGTLEIKTRATV